MKIFVQVSEINTRVEYHCCIVAIHLQILELHVGMASDTVEVPDMCDIEIVT